jgi:hypothetical protein
MYEFSERTSTPMRYVGAGIATILLNLSGRIATGSLPAGGAF